MSLSLSLDFSFLNEDLVNGIINSVKPVFGGNDTRWFKCEKTKKMLIWMVINLSIRLSLPKSPIKISFEHLTEVEQRMALYVATLYTASAIRLSQKHDWVYAQWNTRSLYLLKTMGGASIFRYINEMMLITYKVEWSTFVIFL